MAGAWIDQAVPFHCSAAVTHWRRKGGLCPGQGIEIKCCPTAVHEGANVHDTPLSTTPKPWLGVVWIDQVLVLLVHPSASGAYGGLPRL